MSIIRISHNKENPYVMLNKNGLEDPALSWGAKGIWAYLMSRPDDWEVSVPHLSTIYEKKGGGEKAIYALLNELIDNGYCTRTKLKDDKGLFGKTEYIITELKNKVPHSPQRDVVERDAVEGSLTNKGSLPSKETTTTQVSGSSSELEKLKELAKLPLNTKTIEKALLYSIDDIKLAIECCLNPAKPIDNVDGYLMSALKEKWQPKPNKAKIEAIKEETQQQQQLARQKVCLEAKQLEVTHKYNLKETASFSVNENIISLKIDNGFSPLEMTEQSLKILKKYIKDNQKNVH